MNVLTQTQLKDLPEDVYWYLTSDKGDQISLLIAKKYNLTSDGIKHLGELLRRLYLKKIDVATLPAAAQRLFGLSPEQSLLFAADLAGARLLPVVDWLNCDLAALVASWGGDLSKYQPHLRAQQAAIIQEKAATELALREDDWIFQEAEASETTEVSWSQRQAAIERILSGDLLSVIKLSEEEAELLDGLNKDMVYLLANQPELSARWSGELFNNQEKLSSAALSLSGETVEATVGNWLTYFVNRQGSGRFDLLAATNFATNDPATKGLSTLERHWLIKLLSLYSRLKFFPEGQIGQDPQNWQLFSVNAVWESPEISEAKIKPYSAEPVDLPISRMSTPAPEVKMPAPEDLVKSDIVQPAVNVESVAPTSTSPAAAALALQKQLADYPVGSLERLVLEEELKKYQ